MLKKRFITTVKFVSVSAVILLILFFVEISGMFKNTETVSFNIPEGSGVSYVAQKLKDEKIIGSKWMFLVYSYPDRKDIKAGIHTISKKSYRNIKEKIVSPPKIKTARVTIPEGYEEREIAHLLSEKGLCSEKEFFNEAKIENYQEYWFLNGLDKRKYELEGYLFPDTYEFSYEEGVHSIINKMLKNFESKITEKMKNDAQKSGYSFDQIITMASIVEREAASDEEYSRVAGVFYNRLNEKNEINGYLQSCATVQYILEQRKKVLTVEDTKINSEYNTYKYKGLPPGPISSCGLKTINAAIYPEKTDYLYFVADGNGKHYFAKTYAQHQENMKKAGL